MNRLLLCGAATAILCASAFGQTVVVPNAYTSAVGGASGGAISPAISAEFQTLYASSQFPSTPIYITGFAFRGVPGAGPYALTISGIIQMSNSPNTPSSVPGPLMSNTFANNVGANVATVWSGTNVTVTGAACAISGTTPCPFSNPVVLTTPFFYNPAAGALLFDAKLSSIVQSQSDSFGCSAPSCVVAVTLTTPFPGSATGGGVQTGGSVAQFTYVTSLPGTPVPPSILLTLAGLAIVGFFAATRGVKFA